MTSTTPVGSPASIDGYVACPRTRAECDARPQCVPTRAQTGARGRGQGRLRLEAPVTDLRSAHGEARGGHRREERGEGSRAADALARRGPMAAGSSDALKRFELENEIQATDKIYHCAPRRSNAPTPPP